MKRITFLAAALLAMAAAGCMDNTTTAPETANDKFESFQDASPMPMPVPPVGSITENTVCFDVSWNEDHTLAAVDVYVAVVDTVVVDAWGIDLHYQGVQYSSTIDSFGLFRSWTFGGSTNANPYGGYPANSLARAGGYTQSADIQIVPGSWFGLYTVEFTDAAGSDVLEGVTLFDDLAGFEFCDE